MALQSTKSNLLQLLKEPENRVIALSGKWGTGKSHLWREVQSSSEDMAVQNALYVSLFGLADMNQLKLKLVQSAIPNAEVHPKIWEQAGVALRGLRKVLNSVHKGFSALDELALLAVPTLLKGRVIVLDDIERKHEKLSIDEVLGFIDEFTQLYGARIVLILNSDQLSDRSLWDKLREKVVDQEIRLNTTLAEAFRIAIQLTPSLYAENIGDAIEVCEITNIRVIRKVIRVVNRVLDGRADITNAVLSRVIPSTVLLAAIHYQGIDDGPDFDFVLHVGTPDPQRRKKGDELTVEEKRQATWKLTLQKLGVHSCDDYELLVVDYLQSGLFDIGSVTNIIDRYVSEAETMRAHSLARQIFEHVSWHHNLTDEALLAEAHEVVKEAYLLDPYTVTSLHELISELTGGQALADTMIDNWLSTFKARAGQPLEDHDFFRRRMHPLLRSAFDSLKDQAQAKTTIFDACEYIAKNNAWGTRQEEVLKNASSQDFESVIKTLGIEDLKIFMYKFLDMCVHRDAYVKHFGSAMDHFIEACRSICSAPESGRLGRLIRLLFEDAKLQSHIEPESGEDKHAG